MASYNGESFINEQIESILAQLDIGDELIITDDFSTDRTVEIIEKIRDTRICLYSNEKRLGYCKNFEKAISLAKGDLIFLSDQDDVWVQGKVDQLKKALENYDFVMSDAIVVDEKLNIINESHFKLRSVRQGFWYNLAKTRYVGAFMAFKKSLLEKALPFPKQHSFYSHDFWLMLIAEAYYKVHLIRTGLVLYRRHGKNASTGGEKSKNNLRKRLVMRSYCLLHVILRLR